MDGDDTRQQRDVRPVPDPTVLTTEQLRRELGSLREILQARLDGMDRAQELLNGDMRRVPSETDKQVQHLRELHETKFDGVQTQFEERDKRTEQLSLASRTAIAAALQAQKESAIAQNESNAASVTKSEGAFTKQIDAIGLLVQSTKIAIESNIADIKERLTSIEGRTMGMTNQQSTQHQDSSSRVAMVAMIAAIVLALAGVASFVMSFAVHAK
jgi:hypothetical protein